MMKMNTTKRVVLVIVEFVENSSVKKVFCKVPQNLQENTCLFNGVCFPENFEEFLRTAILQNTCGRLLLASVGAINLTV